MALEQVTLRDVAEIEARTECQKLALHKVVTNGRVLVN